MSPWVAWAPTLAAEVAFAAAVWRWRRRARRYGPRAVVDLGRPEPLEAQTAAERAVWLPRLQALLRGWERVALDFGCGVGRFTSDLAELLDGEAIGVDPVPEFLAQAPAHPRVRYERLRRARLPLPDTSVDVVWACLVLGALRGRPLLQRFAAEIRRVLRPGGLLFAVDHVRPGLQSRHYVGRSFEAYAAAFAPLPLRLLEPPDARGVAVFAGRRP